MADRPVHQLYVDLRGRALARVETALKVAVMVRAGFTRGEIASRLNISAREVRQAVADLQEVADQIDLAAYHRALKLVHSDAERRFLERRLAEL